MSVFCITFSVGLHTLTKVTTYTLQVDSTGFHASKLVNNAGEVNRIESFLFHTQQCKLFKLLWLIDARCVKINFSLLNEVSQDADETDTVQRRRKQVWHGGRKTTAGLGDGVPSRIHARSPESPEAENF